MASWAPVSVGKNVPMGGTPSTAASLSEDLGNFWGVFEIELGSAGRRDATIAMASLHLEGKLFSNFGVGGVNALQGRE